MNSIKQFGKIARARIGAFVLLALALGAASVSAGAGAAAAGSLLIESEPPGASVFIDGRLIGETPLTLPAIAAGVHRVRVVRLGYLENSRLVTVKPGAQATLRTRLTDPAPQAARAAALKIVVLEGEGAVNIIQQKTAVAPVVEVRDRNDQPVAGAIVQFAIRSGRATFNGARTLSVTTDAAGRATAVGFGPTGTGTLRIGMTAAFQGQTATAAITQTSVATAAQATAASGTAGVSSGGFPTGVVTAIGAAAAGGLIAMRKLTPANAAPYQCGLSASFGTGLAAATLYTLSSEGCDEDGDPVTHRWNFGDGTSTIESPALLNNCNGCGARNRSLVTHTYDSPGTFDVTITLSDGSKETTEPIATVTIVSMAGQWALSGSNNIFQLTQSGVAISGSVSSPTGSGAVTGTAQRGNGILGSVSAGGVISASQSDTTVTLAVTSVTGTSVTSGMFTGRQSVDLNSFSGTFTTAGGTRAAVITRQ
jgi:hypothetical protein